MENNREKPWWHESIMSFLKISTWIVFPIVFGVILGNYLDTVFKSGVIIEVSLTGVLFILSLYHMIKDSKKYEDDIEHKDHPERFSDEIDSPSSNQKNIK